MLGIIGSDRKVFPPYWVKGMLQIAHYKEILAHKVFLAFNATYGEGNWVWTQNGAPCHTSRATQKYLQRKLGSNRFWSKLWSPNSPNLNLLDYYIWSTVEREAYGNYHSSVAALRASVEEAWKNISANTQVSLLQVPCQN